MSGLDPRIATVTARIIERSKPSRRRYLELMGREAEHGLRRPRLSCGNFAHGFAAAGEDKESIRQLAGPNLAIVTAYNDMLSAHQPYGRYPEQMKIFAREVGATMQVAGGTPAMAGKWIAWLVDPPVASSPTAELTIARSSTTSPSGRCLSLAKAAKRCTAARVSAWRSGVPGLTKAAPGMCRPINSIIIWFELAVPKKVQVPAP